MLSCYMLNTNTADTIKSFLAFGMYIQLDTKTKGATGPEGQHPKRSEGTTRGLRGSTASTSRSLRYLDTSRPIRHLLKLDIGSNSS